MASIAVVGNGVIGSLLCLKLIKLGYKIDHYCDFDRIGSASKAAGAMLNVISEIEDGQFDLKHLSHKIDCGIASLSAWEHIIPELNSMAGSNDLCLRDGFKIIKSAISPYEQSQLAYILGDVKSKYPDYVLESDDYVDLPLEKSLDARLLLKTIDGILNESSLYTKLPRLSPTSISRVTKASTVVTSDNGNEKSYGMFFLCVGSMINSFKTHMPGLFENVQDVFHGIGSALLIDVQRKYQSQSLSDDLPIKSSVVRTLNRGGACGWHAVKCDLSDYYVGATNSVSHTPEYIPRTQSLHILSEGVTSLLGESFSQHLARPVVGFRPTSIDAAPLVGNIQDTSIYLISGTKRDGLTLAPILVDAILKSSFDIDPPQPSSIDLPETLKLFDPERVPYSYYNSARSSLKFGLSYASGVCMHKKVNPSHWDDLVGEGQHRAENIHNHYSFDKFGIFPELLGMFKNQRISSKTINRLQMSYS